MFIWGYWLNTVIRCLIYMKFKGFWYKFEKKGTLKFCFILNWIKGKFLLVLEGSLKVILKKVILF